MPTLITLPVELLYDIQLFATSPSLPRACQALHHIFSSSPASYRAQYLIACTKSRRLPRDVVLTKILRYPICTQTVLEAYFRTQTRGGEAQSAPPPELPRRLFRTLGSATRTRTGTCKSKNKEWTDRDPPLPFLRHLYDACNRHFLHSPNANSHEGYALTKAVQVGFVPLIRFLLDHGASPALKGSLPVIIAIHRRDLGLVKMLVERGHGGKSHSDNSTAKGKRRRLEDRVEVTAEMLRTAVKCKAQDIVEYLMREKGCIPDMQTLLLIR